jgi:hypothetical protein
MSARIFIMNHSMHTSGPPGDDPLGLGKLPEAKPEAGSIDQDWAVVSTALDRRNRNRRFAWLGAAAAAASIALVIAIAGLPGPVSHELPEPGQATAQAEAERPADIPDMQTAEQSTGAENLMAMSQDAERQLRRLRGQVSAMPSELVVYQVELQDLIAQVDDAISLSPESAALWGERLSLQLDLMKLYSSQLRREYARVASL